MEQLSVTVGKRLRTLRKEKGFKQYPLADMLEVDRSVIAKYETGVTCPSIVNLIKLSKIFGVTTDYILCLTDERK